MRVLFKLAINRLRLVHKWFRLSLGKRNIILTQKRIRHASPFLFLRKDKDNMKRNTVNLTRIISVVCAVLMLALLVCQFIPFWNLDGREASIGGYIWLESHYDGFTAYFQEWLNDGDFYSGSIVGVNVILMLACAAGIVFCIKNSEELWPIVFPAACGILGLYQYLAIPVFQLGSNCGIHLAICIATLVMAFIALIAWVRDRKTA